MFKEILEWLKPGLGIKRWLFVIGLGLLFFSLGIAVLLVHIYRTTSFPGITGTIAYYVTAQPIPRLWRGTLLILLGLGMVIIGNWYFQKTFLSPFIKQRKKIPQIIKNYRQRGKGPRIVTLGGGTGMSTLLRGLKTISTNITAIATVADNGGSSGRLRENLGVLPPGDIRQNIIALSDTESLLSKLFNYRFEGDRYGDNLSLGGHNFGNLLLVAMSSITGDFTTAVRESAQILAIKGQVLPASGANITLCAKLTNGEEVEGEENIDLGNFNREAQIKEVFLKPSSPPATPEAITAIKKAQLVLIGPGDIYTSIIPNFLIPQIEQAVKNSSARKIFICNIANKKTETPDFNISDHWKTFCQYYEGKIDFVVANNNHTIPAHPERPYVKLKPNDFKKLGNILRTADLIDDQNHLRHSPIKLAEFLSSLYNECK